MARRTGAQTIGAAKLGGTWGTAAEVGAGDRLTAEFTRARNPNILRPSPIGQGLEMDSESDAVGVAPTVGIALEEKYDDPAMAIEALFFGADSCNAYGDGYSHSFIFDAARNTKFATIAFEGTSAETYEYPSCTPTRVQIEASPNAYVRKTIDLLANDEVISSQTNDNADLAATTEADSTRVVAKPEHYMLINAQGGAALSTSTDVIEITQASIEYIYSASNVMSIRGAAGNDEPIADGDAPFQANLTITLKELADFTWLDAQAAGTEYKAELRITGATIGGGASYQVSRFFPRLIILQDPQYSVTQAGVNPCTVTFKALVASTNPTGMISCYPYVIVTNTQATGYLA